MTFVAPLVPTVMIDSFNSRRASSARSGASAVSIAQLQGQHPVIEQRNSIERRHPCLHPSAEIGVRTEPPAAALKRFVHGFSASAERHIDAQLIRQLLDRRQRRGHLFHRHRFHAKTLRELERLSRDLVVLADCGREVHRHPHVQQRHPVADGIHFSRRQPVVQILWNLDADLLRAVSFDNRHAERIGLACRIEKRFLPEARERHAHLPADRSEPTAVRTCRHAGGRTDAEPRTGALGACAKPIVVEVIAATIRSPARMIHCSAGLNASNTLPGRPFWNPV